MKVTPYLLSLLLSAVLATGAAMTNPDVLKMVDAKLDEAIILSAIQNTEAKFDTSAEGLISLSAAKVPQALITAMIKRNASHESKPTPAPVEPATELMKPSEVFLRIGEENKVMQYLTPQMRTAARGLGFGGVATYSVLRGTAAGLRIRDKNPSFLIAVPDQAQPASYFTLASFAVRQNNSREVLVGGGFMSYSTGIHPDRLVAVRSEKAKDQSRAPKGFTLYTVSPEKPMPTGEFAVILYTGEMQGLVGTWFSGTGNSYFDFGIDP